MQEFEYTIKDSVGIHARPAGLLVKLAQKFKSDITLCCNGKCADAKRLFGIMGLAVKFDDKVRISISGEDENEAKMSLMEFFGTNL